MDILQERLRKLRTEKGLKQADVADAISVARGTYSSYENGITPPLSTCISISSFYHVTLDYLLGLSNERNVVRGNIEGKINAITEKNADFPLKASSIMTFLDAAEHYFMSEGSTRASIPFSCLERYIVHLGNALKNAAQGDLASLVIEVNAAVVAALDTNNMIGEYCKSTEK